ncbi:type 1 pili tip component [Gilvimarinus agarilyticus]|uniref:type 1 pili tip component n=1 Tax=unclassified Gilvimarinus TaxID=2642066 RepID=UPI001C096537|nr:MULTISPECIES: type 1 pili tip component [unclassified Gilvimarinus]MBU2887278.1 type 1 pili tip component [Gilvimarinus agarilyticus]MDO6571937.1 type 1 pili tip component [Gilvimarinus sp. 2_MG-2023]MDO6746006.1 type 1 pili tip component [Gilvimarinus sp. 1_MG-2023]
MDKKPCELLAHWEKSAKGQLTQNQYAVRLPIIEAAKLEALAQMYPRLTVEQLISDLLSAALHEVEESMPYVKGSEVVAKDEFGDEVYADEGLTPKFQQLSQNKLQELKEPQSD